MNEKIEMLFAVSATKIGIKEEIKEVNNAMLIFCVNFFEIKYITNTKVEAKRFGMILNAKIGWIMLKNARM